MGKTYLLSDLHFGHKMLVDRGHRPEGFSGAVVFHTLSLFHDLDKRAIKRNRLIILGDLYFSYDGQKLLQGMLDELHRIGTRIVLVRGNHDTRSNQAYMDMGFDWSCDGMQIDVGGKRVFFSHRPALITDPKSWDMNIHGHCHNPSCSKKHHDVVPGLGRILISLEALEYRPVELLHTVQLGATPMYKKGRFTKFTCKCRDCK